MILLFRLTASAPDGGAGQPHIRRGHTRDAILAHAAHRNIFGEFYADTAMFGHLRFALRHSNYSAAAACIRNRRAIGANHRAISRRSKGSASIPRFGPRSWSGNASGDGNMRFSRRAPLALRFFYSIHIVGTASNVA